MPTAIHRAARVFRGHPAIGYVVAFVSVGLATALQWWASDLYQGAPFITIYPAVVVTAFVGGYFFIPQYHWLAVLTYVVDAIVCVLLMDSSTAGSEKE